MQGCYPFILKIMNTKNFAPQNRIVRIDALVTAAPNGIKITDFSAKIQPNEKVLGMFVAPPVARYNSVNGTVASIQDTESILFSMVFQNKTYIEKMSLSVFQTTQIREYYPFEFAVSDRTLENSLLFGDNKEAFNEVDSLYIPLFFVIQI